MKITIVGNRDGKAAVNWYGVVVTTLIVAVFAGLGAAAFQFAVGWSSFNAFALVFFGFVPAFITYGIILGLRTPIEQLPPLGKVV